MGTELRPTCSVLALALVAGGLGGVLSASGVGPGGPPIGFPKGHQVPLLPGGTALRLAMVHDVVHQRFPKHGPAWHEAIAARAQARIAALPAGEAPSLEALRDFDDLGAALDRLGRSDEAVAVLERKRDLLTRHHAPPPEPSEPPLPTPAEVQADVDLPDMVHAGSRAMQERFFRYERMVQASERLSELELAWYRTHANLGTFLIHAHLRDAMAGDAEAQEALRAGAERIDAAIALNPGAHFGRERWQARAVRNLLDAIASPQSLLEISLLGLPLDPLLDPPIVNNDRPYGLPLGGLKDRTEAILAQDGAEAYTRQAIWDRWQVRHTSPLVTTPEGDPVPFDEPVLAVLGMWMFGGGANPHFCLALGGLMERIGQRRIAWSAYARALDLGERFWPDPAIREGILAQVRRRQRDLELSLALDHDTAQARFEAELAHGEAYQQAYADYEAERLAAGTPVDAPDFHAAFLTGHGRIASPVGRADTRHYLPDRAYGGGTPTAAIVAAALVCGGAGAWLGVLSSWLRRRKRPRPRSAFADLDA